MTDATAIVVTLVARDPGFLTEQRLHDLQRALVQGAGEPVSRKWLSDGEAVDFFYPADRYSQVRRTLENLLKGEPIDWLVQDSATRKKALLVADMESTIIEQEMLDELADFVGLREKVADITARAMNGEIDFAAALRERVALLKGLSSSVIDSLHSRITFMPGAQQLVATMKHNKATCYLVSGGFSVFAEIVARRLHFDVCRANRLTVADGCIVGTVPDPILDKLKKSEILTEAVTAQGCNPARVLAVGDGSNDVPMLLSAAAHGGLGVAFHGKPAVRAQVAHQINHGDLTVLLFAQGFARSAFHA